MENRLWSRRFTAVVLSNLLMAWTFYGLMPTLPVYLTGYLGISHSHTGLVMAAFSIAGIVMRPFAGYIIDNFHRPLVFVLALVASTIAYGVYPLVGGVWAMFTLRFVHGAIWGICSSSTAPLVGDAVPPARLGEGIGIYALSFPVGMTLGPMFGFGVLREYGAGAMFLSIFGISFLSLVIALFAKTPYRAPVRKRFSVAALLSRKALPFSSCMFFIMIAYGAIVVFVGVHAARKGFPNVASFFLCLAASLFLSRAFTGKLFDRGYMVQLILTGVTLIAVGTAWLGYAWSPAQLLVSGVIAGLGFGMLMPTCQAAINSLVDPGERGCGQLDVPRFLRSRDRDRLPSRRLSLREAGPRQYLRVHCLSCPGIYPPVCICGNSPLPEPQTEISPIRPVAGFVVAATLKLSKKRTAAFAAKWSRNISSFRLYSLHDNREDT